MISFKAVGLSVDKDAAKEAATAVAACERIINELFPAVLATMQVEDDAVSMTMVPFLTAYVMKLKAEQKR